jgi:hypothetical protein
MKEWLSFVWITSTLALAVWLILEMLMLSYRLL